MNIGYEDDDLKPYVEPSADNSDHIRIGNNRVGAFLCQMLQISLPIATSKVPYELGGWSGGLKVYFPFI